MKLSRTKCNKVDLSGTNWNKAELNGTKRNNIDLSGTNWN